MGLTISRGHPASLPYDLCSSKGRRAAQFCTAICAAVPVTTDSRGSFGPSESKSDTFPQWSFKYIIQCLAAPSLSGVNILKF